MNQEHQRNQPRCQPTRRECGEFRIQRLYTRTDDRGSGPSLSTTQAQLEGQFSWRFFRPGISPQLPREIVPQTGTASGTKCVSRDSVRQQQRRVNVAVNHPIVDQNPEKVITDISFTPLSQRTFVLDVDQTFRAGATRHQRITPNAIRAKSAWEYVYVANTQFLLNKSTP